MIDDHGFKSSKSELKYNYEFVWIKNAASLSNCMH